MDSEIRARISHELLKAFVNEMEATFGKHIHTYPDDMVWFLPTSGLIDAFKKACVKTNCEDVWLYFWNLEIFPEDPNEYDSDTFNGDFHQILVNEGFVVSFEDRWKPEDDPVWDIHPPNIFLARCDEETRMRLCSEVVFDAIASNCIQNDKDNYDDFERDAVVLEILERCTKHGIGLTIALHAMRWKNISKDDQASERIAWATRYLYNHFPYDKYGDSEIHGIVYTMSESIFERFVIAMYNQLKNLE
jgi:hypothetical protein